MSETEVLLPLDSMERERQRQVSVELIAQNVLDLGGRGKRGNSNAGGTGTSGSRSSRRRPRPLPSPSTDDPMDSHPHPNKKSKRMRRHKKSSKRFRRAIQPAPNNNNEFLMQEHDHLYHLDQSNDEDPNSEELNHQYSSPEDEEEFLTRDFSNAYDVVHAERLSTMSKHELIQEYQLLEERVESLERKLRSALIDRRLKSELFAENSNSAKATSSEPEDRVRICQDELGRLREENRKLKSDNKLLRKIHLNVARTSNGHQQGDEDSGPNSDEEPSIPCCESDSESIHSVSTCTSSGPSAFEDDVKYSIDNSSCALSVEGSSTPNNSVLVPSKQHSSSASTFSDQASASTSSVEVSSVSTHLDSEQGQPSPGELSKITNDLNAASTSSDCFTSVSQACCSSTIMIQSFTPTIKSDATAGENSVTSTSE